MDKVLNLKWGFSFHDLYDRDGLTRLDTAFVEQLKATDVELFNRMMDARANPPDRKAAAELIIALAPQVEDFVAELFDITAEVRDLQAKHSVLEPLFPLKRKFVQKKAISGVTAAQAALIDGPSLAAETAARFNEPFTEQSFVEHVSRWLDDEPAHAGELAIAQKYAAWAALSPAGQAKHHHGVLFRVPHKLDPNHLVPVETWWSNGIAAWRCRASPGGIAKDSS